MTQNIKLNAYNVLPNGPYDSLKVEPEILTYWLENNFYKPEYHPEKGLQSKEEMEKDGRESFCIVNPPPNAYMRPHIGNVSGYAYQDVFLRYNRLKGKKVLGQPGKDHAGIQGEVVLEKLFLENKGKSKQELGREKFYKASYSHFIKIMPKVMDDEKRIGLSSDYDRNLFTLDPKVVETVLGTFMKMFEDKMVYKGVRIVNWDPVAQTTLADIDTEREERDSELVYIKYPLVQEQNPSHEIRNNTETESSKITTIVLDLYKVVFFSTSDKYKKVADMLGLSEAETRSIIDKEYENWKEEDKNVEELFWKRIADRFNLDETGIREFKENWWYSVVLNDTLVEYIKQLKQKGYNIAFMTNSFEDWIVDIDTKLKFLHLFDYKYYCLSENTPKPTVEGYKKFEEKSGLEPKEILFIDDSNENLEAAQKHGWQTFFFENDVDSLAKFVENNSTPKSQNPTSAILESRHPEIFSGSREIRNKIISWKFERSETLDKKHKLPFAFGHYEDIEIVALGYENLEPGEKQEGKVIGIQQNATIQPRLVVMNPDDELSKEELDAKILEIYEFEKAYYAGAHIELFENQTNDYLLLTNNYIVVATTRAETMLGDTAVVVNAKDKRYKDLIGKKLLLPIVNREIPIITSPHVDMEFGTGAVKLTPAHSMDDYKMMNEWNSRLVSSSEVENKGENSISYINVIDKQAKMTGPIPIKYKGLSTEECRKQIIEDLEAQNLIVRREPHKHAVMIGERSKAVIEQIMSSQWFIDVEKLKQPAIDAVRNGEVKIHPEYMVKKYLNWMENLHDWPVSRSLWWGYRIPVWYKGEITEGIDQTTGQIVETINGQRIDGIYDAVTKGLAKVQIDEPVMSEIPVTPRLNATQSLFLIPGKHGYMQRDIYPQIQTSYPQAKVIEVDNIDNPSYADYKKAFKKDKFDGDTVLVAHSLGTVAIMKYLCEEKVEVKHLVLVAPPVNPREKDKQSPYAEFFDNLIWRQNVHKYAGEVSIIYSDNDEHGNLEDFRAFSREFRNVKVYEETNKGHYASKEQSHNSEALEEILRKEFGTNDQSVHITALRHGETDDNRAKIFCGSRETPLNDIGKNQAEEFANKISKNNYDLIISSPITRARETAEIINETLKLPIEFDERIRERNFGVVEGKTWEKIEKEMPELASQMHKSYQIELPEGESINEVDKRIEDFIQEIGKKYAGKRILLVTHTGALRILRRKLLGESIESTRKNDPGNLATFEMFINTQNLEPKTHNVIEWIQDPDVFDTWFSSGQWPYAALGANDLMDTFYPSDIMETGYDILELWVSRMIMLSLYTQNKVPFKNVYLHGLVKAPDGQKMGKSKGNVIQPEEIIKKYGADALRLMYIVGNKAGSGYPISYEKLEGYKRFLNKIWNASKFVLSNLADFEAECITYDVKHAVQKDDKEILESLAELKKSYERQIGAYRIGMAAEEIYNNFWHTFCDEYLEKVKFRLYTKDKEGKAINTSQQGIESRKQAQATLLYALKEYMKLLHPFTPFITEKIWQSLPKDDKESKTIMYAQVD